MSGGKVGRAGSAAESLGSRSRQLSHSACAGGSVFDPLFGILQTVAGAKGTFNPNSEIGIHDMTQSVGGKAICRNST
jgi:hypothetical protein